MKKVFSGVLAMMIVGTLILSACTGTGSSEEKKDAVEQNASEEGQAGGAEEHPSEHPRGDDGASEHPTEDEAASDTTASEHPEHPTN